ncbi:MAG: HDOD domain-containing protein [Acidobacteriota bacterium]
MATEITASVGRLLAAIQKSGEFPAMAHSVDVISSMTASESTSSEVLAQVILQDFGLTQKLLKMVNTLAYSQYGEVTTITRAVLLMGFDRVRAMATSLILFEHFRKQGGNSHLAEALNKAFYGAVLGRTIAQQTGVADAEEAFISTLYQRLGRILVAFYLPDDYKAIEAVPDDERDRMALQVLGLSFEMMGLEIADHLRMPDVLRKSMTIVPCGDLSRAMNAEERLSCVATLSNAIVDVLATPGDASTRRGAVERLMTEYAPQIKMTEKVDALIARTVAEVKRSASTFNLKLGGTELAASLASWGLTEHGVGARAARTESGPDAPPPPDSPETILSKGVHEVTALLISESAVDDVFRAVLETIYRAIGVGQTKVLFLLKDPSAGVARFRFGFGYDPDDLKLWSEVKISGSDDLIGQALIQGRDMVIRNARVPAIVQSMPMWLARRGVLDRIIVLLPLSVGQNRVGFFYIDADKTLGPVLTPAFVHNLKVLRDHVMLAIQQRAARKSP